MVEYITMRYIAVLLLVLLLSMGSAGAATSVYGCLPELASITRYRIFAKQWATWESERGGKSPKLPFHNPKELAKIPADKLVGYFLELEHDFYLRADRSSDARPFQEARNRVLDAIHRRPAEEKLAALASILRTTGAPGAASVYGLSTLLHGRDLDDVVDRGKNEGLLEQAKVKHQAVGGHTWTHGVYETDVQALVHFDRMAKIKDSDTIVDIGSGFGSPGLVFGTLHPKAKFIGYDIVPMKVAAAKASAERWGLDNVSFFEQDLSERRFKLPAADVYYLYSPVNGVVAKKLLAEMKEIGKTRKFTLIVMRSFSNDFDVDLSKEDWLVQNSPGSECFRVK